MSRLERNSSGRVWRIGIALLAVATIAVAALLARRIWNRITERDAVVSAASSASPPSSLASLLVDHADSFVGDMVFLNEVRVHPGPARNVLIVSGAQGRRMLAFWEGARPCCGDDPITADIQGRIRPLPPTATLRRQWKLSKEQARAFGEQQIYILAESIKPGEKRATSD
jgi:hypothetical protein